MVKVQTRNLKVKHRSQRAQSAMQRQNWMSRKRDSNKLRRNTRNMKDTNRNGKVQQQIIKLKLKKTERIYQCAQNIMWSQWIELRVWSHAHQNIVKNASMGFPVIFTFFSEFSLECIRVFSDILVPVLAMITVSDCWWKACLRPICVCTARKAVTKAAEFSYRPLVHLFLSSVFSAIVALERRITVSRVKFGINVLWLILWFCDAWKKSFRLLLGK